MLKLLGITSNEITYIYIYSKILIRFYIAHDTNIVFAMSFICSKVYVHVLLLLCIYAQVFAMISLSFEVALNMRFTIFRSHYVCFFVSVALCLGVQYIFQCMFSAFLHHPQYIYIHIYLSVHITTAQLHCANIKIQ